MATARKTAKKTAADERAKRDPGQIVQINFKAPDEFKQRIELFAVRHRMNVKEVLVEAFERLERSGL